MEIITKSHDACEHKIPLEKKYTEESPLKQAASEKYYRHFHHH